MITNPPRIEILDEGVSQGRVTRVDYTGTGVAATVSGETATVNIAGGGGAAGDLALSKKAPTANFVVTAGYSAYVSNWYELVAGIETEIGLGSTLEIG